MEDNWSRYRAGEPGALDALVEQYWELPGILARKALARAPAWQDPDDIRSYALAGLLDAISKFDPDVGVKFETYATRRITGAIKDGQRKDDPLVRSERKRVKELDTALIELQRDDPLRGPTIEELAEHLQWEAAEVSRVQLSRQSLAGSIDTEHGVLDTWAVESEGDTAAMMAEMRQHVAQRASMLDGPSIAVLLAWYVDGKTQRQVSGALRAPSLWCDQRRKQMLMDLRS